ncbi:MAG: nitrogen fixation protein NifH [Alphaproteobacteria bacterium HGW-Alphaproteobacteria-4]|nr:MAG: nitrogen fixation protein NifH [Alphaproteobacteria bacterium HGW-Alphaproteobacteria-4]
MLPAPAVLDWLLEDENPSVRYFTLKRLLGRDEADPALQTARRAIMASPAVRAIMDQQHPDGYWLKPGQFYTGKYRSTVWQLLILAELGADPADARIRAACAFILTQAQHRESGGFSEKGGRNGGQASVVLPCLTGNMAWVLLRFGLAAEPRVQAAVDWITTYQRFDDGIAVAPQGWPYDRLEPCWGRHSCHMGVVKAMKALAEIPPQARTAAVAETLARAAEFMLIHHIHKRSHDLARKSKPGWLRFGFPLMYQTDVLEILNLLLDLGYRDPRMDAALAVVAEKRGADGRWRLENSYNDKFTAPIEQLGAPSKWITLNALRALGRAG